MAEVTVPCTLLRRWMRCRVDVPIRLIVRTVAKTKIIDGRGTSLSEGGMALFVGAELRPGDLVAVEFTPAYSAPPIRVDATICNRTGYNYGVEFLTVSDSQKQRVEDLHRHLPTMTAISGTSGLSVTPPPD
jgi:hypothetical protein